jgi:hypothetical protein
MHTAVRGILESLAAHGDGPSRGYEWCDGKTHLAASGLSVEEYRDAVALALEAGLIDASEVIPTPDNGRTGIVGARLTPKGREELRRAGGAVESPLADARLLHKSLRESGDEDRRGRTPLDSTTLERNLGWPARRVLEAAEVLVGQGAAEFARLTMNNFFVLSLTPRGRL